MSDEYDDGWQQLMDDERRFKEWEERMEWLEEHKKSGDTLEDE